MNKIVIDVLGVSKQYRLGRIGTGSFAHDLNRWWHSVRGKGDPYLKIGEVNDRMKAGGKYVWALNNISFNVAQGDVLGIIGRNGAGKSTLLKILSRTTLPTAGSIKVRGRIASLLEVGTGFHPELTGRENIFLNGAILGMRKHEITTKFDEIVNFSGVEKYIDTPVKRYSSGMYVRLAFAVAAHLDPEILIVDEVLAVGDAEFQKKALGKMNDVSKSQGRAVLFVSHNIGAIRQLCKSCLLLKNGNIESLGSVDSVVRQYFKGDHELRNKPLIEDYRQYNVTNSPIIIEDVSVKGFDGILPILEIGDEPEVLIRVNSRLPVSGANITISFHNSEATNVGLAFSWDDNFYLNTGVGKYEIAFKLVGMKLAPGEYFIGVGLNQATQTLAWDGIKYYPIFVIENQNNVVHFGHRSWGVNHLVGNRWTINNLFV